MKLYEHHPHPHIESRKNKAPKPRTASEGPLAHFNSFLAEKITVGVGTMWCAYAFAAIALISLPDALHSGTLSLIHI